MIRTALRSIVLVAVAATAFVSLAPSASAAPTKLQLPTRLPDNPRPRWPEARSPLPNPQAQRAQARSSKAQKQAIRAARTRSSSVGVRRPMPFVPRR